MTLGRCCRHLDHVQLRSKINAILTEVEITAKAKDKLSKQMRSQNKYCKCTVFKIKFSSHIRKFSVDQLQSHI